MSDLQSPSTFGYSYLGSKFNEILRLEPEGIVYAGHQRIPWSNIFAYRAYPNFFQDQVYARLHAPRPRLWVYLTDGHLIKIRGDLITRFSESPHLVSRIPAAFEQLVDEIKLRHIRQWLGPRDEVTLFRIGFALFVIGFLLAFTIVPLFEPGVPAIGAGIVAGVIAAQVAFIIAPIINLKLRRRYIERLTRAASIQQEHEPR